MSTARITKITVTPVAFRDPPLLNAVGVHEPFALRSIIEVETDAGVVGLGESYGDAGFIKRLEFVAEELLGANIYATGEIRRLCASALHGASGADKHGLTGQISAAGTVLRVYGAFEVACLDIQGKLAGVPVCDLLGGALRSKVPFSAYLFYKWATHPGAEPDDYLEALNPEQIVAQAKWMVDFYGFEAIKLKGGVLAPREEIDTILALRDAFPDAALRLDPNTAWSVSTSIMVGTELEGTLEYLEDPTPGLLAMDDVARAVSMPLATNMCVVGFEDIAPALAHNSVGIILSDHHYWGGLRETQSLAAICRSFDLGLSMHSNSHLGISLAAMTHVASAVENLTYALDTHWPWKSEDVICEGSLSFEQGCVKVPHSPGLGVELDRDALARLHEQYVVAGLTERNDTRYMQQFHPAFSAELPRW